MFGWNKRRAPGPWQSVDLAPDNVVLILAVQMRSTPGAAGPIYYPAQCRIGWRPFPGVWTDFITGAPLDIEPEVFMELPAITTAPPALPMIRWQPKRRRAVHL